MNTLSRYTCLVGLALLLPMSQVLAEDSFTDSAETAFVDDGKISIKLTAGQHTISASDDDTIRISWKVDFDDVHKVDTETKVDGSSAKIDIDGPRENFRTFIEVPKNSDIEVRLTAGELDIEGIEGSQDIRLRAGDLSIEVGDTDAYSKVTGSLWAGDIDAGPFSQEKSGLFRSIEWEGDGDHRLNFKLYAGDVKLYQAQN